MDCKDVSIICGRNAERGKCSPVLWFTSSRGTAGGMRDSSAANGAQFVSTSTFAIFSRELTSILRPLGWQRLLVTRRRVAGGQRAESTASFYCVCHKLIRCRTGLNYFRLFSPLVSIFFFHNYYSFFFYLNFFNSFSDAFDRSTLIRVAVFSSFK